MFQVPFYASVSLPLPADPLPPVMPVEFFIWSGLFLNSAEWLYCCLLAMDKSFAAGYQDTLFIAGN